MKVPLSVISVGFAPCRFRMVRIQRNRESRKELQVWPIIWKADATNSITVRNNLSRKGMEIDPRVPLRKEEDDIREGPDQTRVIWCDGERSKLSLASFEKWLIEPRRETNLHKKIEHKWALSHVDWYGRNILCGIPDEEPWSERDNNTNIARLITKSLIIIKSHVTYYDSLFEHFLNKSRVL